MSNCKYCILDINAHSFKLNGYVDINNLTIKKYYTKISDAKLFNKPETIIYHIQQEFINTKLETNNMWIWDINFENADLKHYLAFNTVIELSKWIKNSNFGKQLKQINIHNARIMGHSMIILAKLYLPNHIIIKNIT